MHSNEFTQWCESNGLTDEACLSASEMKAVECLLNDAACQSRGSSFDSSRVTAAMLNTKNKPELINMIQNYAWFCQMVVVPYVVEVDAELFKDTTKKLEETEAKLEEVTGKINSMQDTVAGSVAILSRDGDISPELTEKSKKIEETMSSVKEELKGFAAVVKKSCTASLAPRKLQAAMVKASSVEDRSSNLIIYGLTESVGEEKTEDVVLNVLEHTNERPKLVSCRRLGEKKEGKKRPVKVVLHNRDMVRSILARSEMLREVEGMSDV
eukprot:sb/3468225/